jgi:hypothetical protein
MYKWTVTLLVGLALAMTAAVGAQQGAAGKKGTLTAADYVEIEQLYARYNHYIDSVKDDGWAYARLFTADGVFDTGPIVGVHTGHEELAALSRSSGRAGEVSPNHIAYNIMIEPSAEGAVGAAYYGFVVQSGEPGQTANARPSELGKPTNGRGFGMYKDRFVKTADGWRFKYRLFVLAGTDVDGDNSPVPSSE